jgi:hypothetical protein
MKMFMRFVYLPVLLAVSVINTHAQANDWSKRITSTVRHPIAEFVNPHRGDINVLTVDGKRFEHVRGFKPFYLPVPGMDSIVFVVVERDYSYTYHVINMGTDEDIAIHARHSGFGETIGFTNCCDFVEKGSDGTLLLSTIDKKAKSDDRDLANLAMMKETYLLDLQKKTIAAHRVIYFDEFGKIIAERGGAIQ